MKNYCRLDHSKKQIIMDRTFAKNSENTRSEEYSHLQQVRHDYPNYTIIRRTIKKNNNKKTYKGLNYDYMRNYILKCDAPVRERYAILAEFEELLLISKCQSKSLRYPVIKHWFFEKFPEIEKFGIELKEPVKDEEEEAQDEIVDEEQDEVLDEAESAAEETPDEMPEKISA